MWLWYYIRVEDGDDEDGVEMVEVTFGVTTKMKRTDVPPVSAGSSTLGYSTRVPYRVDSCPHSGAQAAQCGAGHTVLPCIVVPFLCFVLYMPCLYPKDIPSLGLPLAQFFFLPWLFISVPKFLQTFTTFTLSFLCLLTNGVWSVIAICSASCCTLGTLPRVGITAESLTFEKET